MKPPAYGSSSLTNQEDTWVLALRGEHDLATQVQLEQQVEQVCATGTRVVIDLTRATFIDCRVVGLLLRWSKRARSIDRLHLAVVVGPNGSFSKRVIDLLKATEMIPCHATQAEALASVRHWGPEPKPTSTSSADSAASDLVCA